MSSDHGNSYDKLLKQIALNKKIITGTNTDALTEGTLY